MDRLHRFDFKIFVRERVELDPLDLMAVFQRWIQKHTIPGTLIDAADYSHMHDGPGVILVAHEFNVSIDYTGGRMGLLYHQKQPAHGYFQDRVREVFKQALVCCAEFEQEPEFQGKVQFNAGDFLFIVNDRLVAPNNDHSYEILREQLFEGLSPLYTSKLEFTYRKDDPRDRLVIAVKSTEEVNLKPVLHAFAGQASE